MLTATQSSKSAGWPLSREEDTPARRYAPTSPLSHHDDTEKATRLTHFRLQVVIIQPFDTGSKSHPFPHALVVGIERYPSKVTRRMGEARRNKSSKIKPFIKTVNYNHLMPTRYTLELEGLKTVVSHETFKETSQREEAKKTTKKILEERFTSGKNKWFFTPLSMGLLLQARVVNGMLIYGRVLRGYRNGDTGSSDSRLLLPCRLHLGI